MAPSKRKFRWAVMLGAALSSSVPGASAETAIVSFVIVNGRAVPESLTGRTGDAEAGRKLYFDRALTGCSGCHGSPGGPGAQQNADAQSAPKLSGLASRMDAGEIRMWLIAPKLLNPRTSMPGYYELGQRVDERDPQYGGPQLSADEIEAIVAYLARQK
ncbi:MAG: cytochrome c [Pseudomonadota bacterium]